jgi:hypothetical protein
MALTKTVLASASFVEIPNSTTVGSTFAGEPTVFSNIVPSTSTTVAVVASTNGLLPPTYTKEVGVFTAGTPLEYTASNTTNDNNS